MLRVQVSFAVQHIAFFVDSRRAAWLLFKELRQEREALLRRKVDLQKKSLSAARVLPIRTELMAQYVREMQACLREKNIGYKKGFSTRNFEGGQNQR
jgi:hypothetical protein